MTKKHFNELAKRFEAIRPRIDAESEAYRQWCRDVEAVADTCRMFNGAFDRDRFYRAAGMYGD